MKTLYLVRHGIAKDVGEDGIRKDFDRPLSALGIERTEQVMAGLDTVIVVYPDVILTSPLIRAKETAKICELQLTGSREVVSTDMLEPGVPPVEMMQWIDHLDWTCMMLVGHMPDMAMLAGACLTSEALDIVFKKASVCCIHFDRYIQPRGGELVWHLQPGILRRLA